MSRAEDGRKGEKVIKKQKGHFYHKLSGVQIAFCVLFSFSLSYCFRPAIAFVFSERNSLQIIVSLGIFLILLVGSGVYIIKCGLERKTTDVEKTQRERYTGIDLLRCIAVAMVIILHYLIAIGYYEESSGTLHFYALSMIRWLCMSSCPIFMMMSGYLLGKRELDRSHYMKLLKVLRNYISIVVAFFIINPGSISISTIKEYFSFNNFWYMNMYFGLMLFVPFLNRLFSILKKSEEEVLLIIMLFLSSIWTITDKWTTSYWSALYPILYYYLGMYIRKRKIHIEKISWVFASLLMVAGMSLYSQYIHYGSSFSWEDNFGGYSSGYNALPVVFTSVSCFLLLYDVQIRNRYVARILSEISSVSLEIYLISALITGSRVRTLIWSLNLPCGRDWQMLLILPCELFASFACGKLINYLWNVLVKIASSDIVRRRFGPIRDANREGGDCNESSKENKH